MVRQAFQQLISKVQAFTVPSINCAPHRHKGDINLFILSSFFLFSSYQSYVRKKQTIPNR